VNPRGQMAPLSIPSLASLFQARGTFLCSLGKTPTPVIAVAGVDPRVLQSIAGSWGGRVRRSTSPRRPWRALIAGPHAAELMTAVYPWTRGAVKASIATSLKLAGHRVPQTTPLRRRDRPVARRNVARGQVLDR
jgi:hypothetical protein